MSTTVKDLIDILGDLDPDAVVVLSKDGEGNGFSPFADISQGVYVPDNMWSGEFYGGDEDDDTEDEADPDEVKAIVLWPTN